MRPQAVMAVLALAACAGSVRCASAQAPALSDILAASPASDWRRLDPDFTLYMELTGGRVIIALSPDFSPQHVANVRALARAGYWDGAAITRVQENYVTQWGRPEGDEHDLGAAAAEIGFTYGFAAGRDGLGRTWMLHCYGAVGVARGNPPTTGNGTSLYVPIGQSPRHLDRNVAMVGRVVQGMELLTSLRRGTGALGAYETPQERTPILSVRLAADVPPHERGDLEVLRTDSETFRAVLESRRFRREAWFVEPTGRINVCNVPLPVRAAAR